MLAALDVPPGLGLQSEMTKMGLASFVTGSDLSRAIASVTKAGEADLAVAFWGDRACDLLHLGQDASSLRVACDARSGSCNPKALKALLDRGAKIVDVPRLHAKVYIGRESMVVCSANASANGLGEEDDELVLGTEAGIETSDVAQIDSAREWFNATFLAGTAITKSHLKQIHKLWIENRRNRPPRKPKRRFVDLMREDPNYFTGRRLMMTVYEEQKPSKEIIHLFHDSPFCDERGRTNWDDPPFYFDAEEWKVSIGDLVIDVAVSHGGYSSGGIYRVVGSIAKNKIVPVILDKTIRFTKKDRDDVARLAKALVKKGVLEIDGRLFAAEMFVKEAGKLM